MKNSNPPYQCICGKIIRKTHECANLNKFDSNIGVSGSKHHNDLCAFCLEKLPEREKHICQKKKGNLNLQRLHPNLLNFRNKNFVDIVGNYLAPKFVQFQKQKLRSFYIKKWKNLRPRFLPNALSLFCSQKISQDIQKKEKLTLNIEDLVKITCCGSQLQDIANIKAAVLYNNLRRNKITYEEVEHYEFNSFHQYKVHPYEVFNALGLVHPPCYQINKQTLDQLQKDKYLEQQIGPLKKLHNIKGDFWLTIYEVYQYLGNYFVYKNSWFKFTPAYVQVDEEKMNNIISIYNPMKWCGTTYTDVQMTFSQKQFQQWVRQYEKRITMFQLQRQTKPKVEKVLKKHWIDSGSSNYYLNLPNESSIQRIMTALDTLKKQSQINTTYWLPNQQDCVYEEMKNFKQYWTFHFWRDFSLLMIDNLGQNYLVDQYLKDRKKFYYAESQKLLATHHYFVHYELHMQEFAKQLIKVSGNMDLLDGKQQDIIKGAKQYFRGQNYQLTPKKLLTYLRKFHRPYLNQRIMEDMMITLKLHFNVLNSGFQVMLYLKQYKQFKLIPPLVQQVNKYNQECLHEKKKLQKVRQIKTTVIDEENIRKQKIIQDLFTSQNFQLSVNIGIVKQLASQFRQGQMIPFKKTYQSLTRYHDDQIVRQTLIILASKIFCIQRYFVKGQIYFAFKDRNVDLNDVINIPSVISDINFLATMFFNLYFNGKTTQCKSSLAAKFWQLDDQNNMYWKPFKYIEQRCDLYGDLNAHLVYNHNYNVERWRYAQFNIEQKINEVVYFDKIDRIVRQYEEYDNGQISQLQIFTSTKEQRKKKTSNVQIQNAPNQVKVNKILMDSRRLYRNDYDQEINDAMMYGKVIENIDYDTIIQKYKKYVFQSDNSILRLQHVMAEQGLDSKPCKRVKKQYISKASKDKVFISKLFQQIKQKQQFLLRQKQKKKEQQLELKRKRKQQIQRKQQIKNRELTEYAAKIRQQVLNKKNDIETIPAQKVKELICLPLQDPQIVVKQKPNHIGLPKSFGNMTFKHVKCACGSKLIYDTLIQLYCCQNYECTQHTRKKTNASDMFSELTFQSDKAQVQLNIRKMKAKNKMNNIQQIIQKTFPNSSIASNLFFKGETFAQYKQIHIKCLQRCQVSKQNADIIRQGMQNQRYISVQIKMTKDKGYGVFATQALEPNMFLTCYCGEVYIESQLPNDNNNSNVDIGWLDHNYLVMSPKRYVNLGRFLNGTNYGQQPNVKVEWALVDRKLMLLMIISKKVAKNEELVWNYGKFYSIQSNKQTEKKTTRQLVNIGEDQFSNLRKHISQQIFPDANLSIYFNDQLFMKPKKDQNRDCASVIKLLTCWLCLILSREYGLNIEDMIQVVDIKQLYSDYYTNIGLKNDEYWSIKSLISATLVASACDAAQALAIYFGRKLINSQKVNKVIAISCFLSKMQELAKFVGINSIINDQKGIQTSFLTGQQLCILAKYAFREQTIAQICKITKPFSIQYADKFKRRAFKPLRPKFEIKKLKGKSGSSKFNSSSYAGQFQIQNGHIRFFYHLPQVKSFETYKQDIKKLCKIFQNYETIFNQIPYSQSFIDIKAFQSKELIENNINAKFLMVLKYDHRLPNKEGIIQEWTTLRQQRFGFKGKQTKDD